MINLQFKSSRTLGYINQNIRFNEAVVSALYSFGFVDIENRDDKIIFKHNIKDSNLESFQRRYGVGEIQIDFRAKKLLTLNDYKRAFIFSIFDLMAGIFLLAYSFGVGNGRSAPMIILFFLALVISNVFEYTSKRSTILDKQKKLLEMIDDHIKTNSQDP